MGDESIIISPGDLAGQPDPSAQDRRVIAMWLHGRSKHTVRAYSSDAGAFLSFIDRTLHLTTLEDVQRFALHLDTLPITDGTRHRVMSAIKSLFAFSARLRYLPFDVTAAIRLPSSKETLNERILEEDQVIKLIDSAHTPRDRAMLRMLYLCGLRVSELVTLTWADLRTRRGGAGQATVFGKGRKTRVVLIPMKLWEEIGALSQKPANPHLPVFVSARGGRLDQSQVLRIVKRAAICAGLTGDVSPHWLRHCHASHALDRGCKLYVLQQSLGHSSVATTSKYLHARPSEGSSEFLPS